MTDHGQQRHQFDLRDEKDSSSDEASKNLLVNINYESFTISEPIGMEKVLSVAGCQGLGKMLYCVSAQVQGPAVYLAVTYHMGQNGGRLLSETTNPSLYSFPSPTLRPAISCVHLCSILPAKYLTQT